MFQSLNSYLSQTEPPSVEPDTQGSEPSGELVTESYAEALEETLRKYFGDAESVEDSSVTDENSAVAQDVEDDEDVEEEELHEENMVVDAVDEEDEGNEESEKNEEKSDTLETAESADDFEEADDLDGLWDELLEDLVGEDNSKSSTSRPETVEQDELAEVKQTLESLVSWQTAVQQYLQMSVEAENIRQVAQQLAGLGIILPDEQIQEIARLSQQLNIPPSVLLKAKAYDYTMQQIQQDERAPYPFMNPSRPPAPNILPNARPFQEPTENAQKRTGFTSFREFLKQMGIPE